MRGPTQAPPTRPGGPRPPPPTPLAAGPGGPPRPLRAAPALLVGLPIAWPVVDEELLARANRLYGGEPGLAVLQLQTHDVDAPALRGGPGAVDPAAGVCLFQGLRVDCPARCLLTLEAPPEVLQLSELLKRQPPTPVRRWEERALGEVTRGEKALAGTFQG